MRIWAIVDGIEKEAYLVNGDKYDCYPSSKNTKVTARSFAQIEEAAVFLLNNTTWGIRMNPGNAIIYRDINITR